MKGVKVFTLFVLLALVSSFAIALPVQDVEVKINGDVVENTQTLHFERGEELDIRFRLQADQDLEDVEIRAFISGYEYSDHESLSDVAHISDFSANSVYSKDLTLKLPDKMNIEDGDYTLRIMATDKNGELSQFNYNLEIGASRHAMTIKDVIMSPNGKVEQGRALLATVRVKNSGDRDEEGVKVKVSIPELGISASDYLDQLNAEDTKTSEELLLRIPKCADAKEYKVVTTVEFDEGYESVTEESSVRVTDAGVCEVSSASTSTTPKTIITVGPEVQDVVKAAGGAIYPLTLSNADSTSKTFTISAEAGSWADIKMSPSNVVVLGPNEAKAVYVYVSAKEDASVGEQMFAIKVKSGDETLKEIALKANVVEPANSGSNVGSLKKGLEVGLVVLVVLLVVIGLIIGFNRLKADDDDEDLEAGQTYY